MKALEAATPVVRGLMGHGTLCEDGAKLCTPLWEAVSDLLQEYAPLGQVHAAPLILRAPTVIVEDEAPAGVELDLEEDSARAAADPPLDEVPRGRKRPRASSPASAVASPIDATVDAPLPGDSIAVGDAGEPVLKRGKRERQSGVCLILQGMPGAGKSTLAEILRSAAGFSVVHTDEFIRRKEFCQKTFEKRLQREQPFLIVDGVNCTADHLVAIAKGLERISRKSTGSPIWTPILVRFCAANSPNPFASNLLPECVSRVMSRGLGRHAISSLNGRAAVWAAVERLAGKDPDVEEFFDTRICVDLMELPCTIAHRLVQQMPGNLFHNFQHVTFAMLESAFKAVQSAEREQCRRGEYKFWPYPNGRQDAPMYYGVVIAPEDIEFLYERYLGDVCERFGPFAVRADEPHVTLLFIGDKSIEKLAEEYRISVNRVSDLLTKAQGAVGQQVSVQLRHVVWNDLLAAAYVSLGDSVPCATRNPHVTLARGRNVAPKWASKVLEDWKAQRDPSIQFKQLKPPVTITGRLMACPARR